MCRQTSQDSLDSPEARPDPNPRQTGSKSSRLEQELIAAQRLAMLGTMSGMIAHEFNNLMTPIFTRVDFALSTGEPEDMRRALDKTHIAVKRAMAVADHVLKLAHAEDVPLESCPLAPVVDEAIASAVRPFEKDGIDLSVSVSNDLCVRAQRDLLIQTLLNLLLNARKAMEKTSGGLAISAHQDGDFAVIAVRDSGKGMTAEQFDQVINPFFTSPADDGGAWQHVGLGLSVCRLIVQKHGATITGRPNEGRGCTFELRWPVG